MKKKKAVKAFTDQFFNHHYYFSTVWPYLTSKKKKNSDIIADGKGIISYEIIVDMNSLLLTPDEKFWEKTEFSVN